MEGAWGKIANFLNLWCENTCSIWQGHICSSSFWFLGVLTRDPERTS